LPKGERDRLNAMTKRIGSSGCSAITIRIHRTHRRQFVEEFVTHPILFRHEAVARADAGEIVGHHHPKATVPARGTTLSRPCFVVDSRRLMMPAFGAYTGGLDVRDRPSRVVSRGGRVFLLGRDRLFSFAMGQLNG